MNNYIDIIEIKVNYNYKNNIIKNKNKKEKYVHKTRKNMNSSVITFNKFKYIDQKIKVKEPNYHKISR